MGFFYNTTIIKKLKEQTDAKVEAGRKAKPDFMKGVDDIINKAKRNSFTWCYIVCDQHTSSRRMIDKK